MANYPGGVHVVTKGAPPNGEQVGASGYRYSAETVLHFIMTPDAENTHLCKSYKIRFTK